LLSLLRSPLYKLGFATVIVLLVGAALYTSRASLELLLRVARVPKVVDILGVFKILKLYFKQSS
jgi:hypothetical protein